jgi:hypothetical protein
VTSPCFLSSIYSFRHIAAAVTWTGGDGSANRDSLSGSPAACRNWKTLAPPSTYAAVVFASGFASGNFPGHFGELRLQLARDVHRADSRAPLERGERKADRQPNDPDDDRQSDQGERASARRHLLATVSTAGRSRERLERNASGLTIGVQCVCGHDPLS